MRDPTPDAPDDRPMTDGALLAFGAVIALALFLCVVMFLVAS